MTHVTECTNNWGESHSGNCQNGWQWLLVKNPLKAQYMNIQWIMGFSYRLMCTHRCTCINSHVHLRTQTFSSQWHWPHSVLWYHCWLDCVSTSYCVVLAVVRGDWGPTDLQSVTLSRWNPQRRLSMEFWDGLWSLPFSVMPCVSPPLTCVWHWTSFLPWNMTKVTGHHCYKKCDKNTVNI